MLKYIKFLLISSFVLLLSSCTDDFNLEHGFGEGNCALTFNITCDILSNTRLGSTRSANGEAIKDLTDLHVIFYKKKTVEVNGTTETKYEYFTNIHYANPNSELDIDYPDRPGQSEAKTFSAKNKQPFVIEKGDYVVYAIANMRDLMTNYDVASNGPDYLRKIKVQWHTDGEGYSTDTPNQEMSGYFRYISEDGMPSSGSPIGDPQPIAINKSAMTIHAWVRRLASKVTVAFDTSNLNKDVYIYIQEISIRDIPKECTLVDPYPATPSDEDSPGTEIEFTRPANTVADRIDYSDMHQEYGYADGMELVWSDENPIWPQNAHTNEAEALFFFENLQGKGEEKGKWQDAYNESGDLGSDNKIDHPGAAHDPEDPDWKDAKKWGTYIEVKGYYACNAKGHIGQGPIVYRFMLGQDIHNDYNAYRNHHYKLTLKFNKWANDVDWHIDYEEDPDMIMVNPFFISYIYNQSLFCDPEMSTGLPIRINGTGLKNLKVKIVQNNWRPHNAVGIEEETADNPWTIDYWGYLNDDGTLKQPVSFDDLTQADYDAMGFNVVTNIDQIVKVGQPAPYFGFLSLISFLGQTKLSKTASITYDGTTLENEECPEGLKKDWINGTYNGEYQWKREFPITRGNQRIQLSSDPDDVYEYTLVNENPDRMEVYLPLFTRPLIMNTPTGYSGNNPFYAHNRKAVIAVTAEYEGADGNIDDSKSVTKFDTIYQVPRCINPKGVYRKYNNTNSFEIFLTEKTTDRNTSQYLYKNVEFKGIESRGGWRAWFDPNSEGWEFESGGDEIVGATRQPIRFKVRPKKKIGKNETKCAVLNVSYHGYTCIHKIILRQGYTPLQIVDGGDYWHTFNLQTASIEVTDPCDEGSLFRYGNLKYPIDAKSNQFDEFADAASKELEISGQSNKKTWLQISSATTSEDNPWGSDYGFGVLESLNGEIATKKAFTDLLRDGVEIGFGVLYGDDASETQLDLRAYTHAYYNTDKTTGMRGCFVYNASNKCANVFFPIGSSGFGRRKNSYSEGGKRGVLRYANRAANFPTTSTSWRADVKNAPNFWTIYMNFGAIYWLKENDGGDRAWDINFTTFDFNGFLDNANMSGGTADRSDACFIRLITPNTSASTAPKRKNK